MRHQSSRSAWILVTFLLYLLMAIKDKHCTTILYYFLPTLVEHLGHKCDLPVGNDFSLFFIFVILLSLFSKRFTITPRNPSYLLKNEGEKDENNCTGFHFSVPFFTSSLSAKRKIEHNFWLFIFGLDMQKSWSCNLLLPVTLKRIWRRLHTKRRRIKSFGIGVGSLPDFYDVIVRGPTNVLLCWRRFSKHKNKCGRPCMPTFVGSNRC